MIPVVRDRLVAIVAALMAGWIVVDRLRGGSYDLELGPAILAVSAMIGLATAVWWSTTRQLRLARAAAEQARRDERYLLETKVWLREVRDEQMLVTEGAARIGTYLGIERASFGDIETTATITIHETAPTSTEPTAPVARFDARTLEQLRAGEVVINHDVTADPRTRARFATEYHAQDIASFIALPIASEKGRWIRIFAATMKRPRTWTEREVKLLRELGDSIGIEMGQLHSNAERERLLRELRMFAERLEVKAEARTVELAESEGEYRQIIETSHDAFIAVDADGRIVEWNSRAEVILGWPRAEVLGRELADTIVPEALRASHRRGFARFLATGKGDLINTVQELVALRHDGREIPIELTISAVRTGDNWRFNAFLRDISDRRRVDQTFAGLLESAPDALVIINRAGRIVLVNAEAERLFGYARSELIDQPVDILVPERSRHHHPAQRDGYFERPVVRDMALGLDITGRRRDGTEFPAEITLSPFETADGTWVSSAIRDISVTKERERRLVSSLKENNVLLQEVHHRVKNNLQVISSLMNMQTRGLTDGAARDALVECQNRVQAIALIHETLYQAENYASVHFSRYARTLAENVFQAQGISVGDITLRLEVDDLRLGVDKAIPCGLILTELIVNALKHAFPDERRGTIRVDLRRIDHNTAHLVVADDGRGMQTEPDANPGKSLGMRLVSTLTRQLQGQLEVVHDGGTCVRIAFPIDSETVST